MNTPSNNDPPDPKAPHAEENAFQHRSLLEREVDPNVQRDLFACPHCGHQLSMFTEQSVKSAEKAAASIAIAVGSWPFLLILAICIMGWCFITMVVPLFEPLPSAAVDYLGNGLAVVAAMQGPLILLTQRRESNRDRARDMEAFYIAQNTEADLHELRHMLSRALGEQPTAPLASDSGSA